MTPPRQWDWIHTSFLQPGQSCSCALGLHSSCLCVPLGLPAWLCTALGFTCDHLLTPSVRCNGQMGFPVTFLNRSPISHTRRAGMSSQDWFAPRPKPEDTAALRKQRQRISHIQRNEQKTAERDESMLINTQEHLKSEGR